MAYPIILIPGIARFDVLTHDAVDNTEDKHLDNLHYFKGIRTMLRDNGIVARHATVPFAASVEDCAAALHEELLKVLQHSPKVHLVAHSMGGLDARHMLFADRDRGKIHERVESLATISTPHAGTAVADQDIAEVPDLIPMLSRLGIDIKGFIDLKTDACRAFNDHPEVKAFEETCGIRILTHAGRSPRRTVFGILRSSFDILTKSEGENDGLVSVEHARWRNQPHREILENCDHLNEVGWWDFDQIKSFEFAPHLLHRIHDFYLRLAKELISGERPA